MKIWKEKEKLDVDNRIFWSGNEIKELKENEIFIMGTNPSGVHGAGAAKAGMRFGAKYGIGRGLVGQTYGLITKNLDGKAGYVEKSTGIKYEKAGYQSVSPDMIKYNIEELYVCARQNPDKNFLVTYKYDVWSNGMPKKSLNGYTSQEMLEFFIVDKDVPENIVFHDSYKEQIKKTLKNGQDEEFITIIENGKKLDLKEKNIIWIIDQDDGNPSGIHGAGAAKVAISFGAKYGVGRGLQGQTYALITKNLKAGFTEKATGITYEKDGYNSVTPEQISKNIEELYICAKKNPDKLFIVVYKNETWANGSSKKSLNGYTGEEMFEFFTKDKDIPNNIVIHDSFKAIYKKLLENTQQQEKTIINEPKPTHTYFWKSQSIFSQWHPSKFIYKDLTFSSAEQFMMYSKAKLFGADDVAQKIMDYNEIPLIKNFLNGELSDSDICSDKEMLKDWDKYQKAIKDHGREVKGYVEDVWKSKRVPIVAVASREKYNQNPLYKVALLKCAGTKMVEASPYDKIWGIGLKKEDAIKITEDKWPGLNLLGDVLTDLCNIYTLELKNKKKLKP